MPRFDASPVFPLSVFAVTLLGGVVTTYCYDRGAPLLWRIPAGACTGLAALGLIALPLATAFGLTAWVVALAATIVACPIALLLSERYRQPFWADLRSAGSRPLVALSQAHPRLIVQAVLSILGAALLWRVAGRVMYVTQDGIYTGVSHNIGDLPFHLTVTNRFVYGGNFPPEHPAFAGVGFTYPFLTDFLGGLFVRAGLPMRDVIVWSTFLLCLLLAALLYRWTLDLTGSREAAVIAPALAFFSGGLGWWRFVAEASASDAGAWALLARLPHDYTITADNQFRWGNLVTTLLVTQRGLLLGLPLALIVFHLWWDTFHATSNDDGERRARMVAAGLIAGTLPLIHAHSFAVVIGMAACLALFSNDRWSWLAFFAWSLALGLPQVWWVTHASGVQSGTFLAWSIGWDRGDQDVITFWLKNTGLFIPLIVAAFLWRADRPLVPPSLRRFYLPFVLCFVVPNVLRLAPWIWDNIKVLVYWFVASVPVVALVLGRLMQGGRWRAALATALLIPLTLAGALDVWRVASGAFQERIFDRAGIEFAGMIAANTNPGALILHAPIPNHPIALTGRRSLMGYPGHVWSHGLDAGPRQADIHRMYAGGAAAADLIARYGIDYIVVGPPERLQMTTDEQFFERYERVGESGGYRLYRITSGQHQ